MMTQGGDTACLVERKGGSMLWCVWVGVHHVLLKPSLSRHLEADRPGSGGLAETAP